MHSDETIERLRNLTVDQLLVFCLVQSKGSFRRAGSALNVSQSAVSQKISTLEKAVRSRLFDRTRGSGISLTPAGSLLAELADDLVERLVEFRFDSEVMKDTTPDVPLSVVGAGALVRYQLLPLAIRFRAHHPTLTLRVATVLTSTDVGDSLRSGRAEVGIYAGPVPGASLRKFGSWVDPLIAVVPESHRPAAVRCMSPRPTRPARVWIQDGVRTRGYEPVQIALSE